MEQDWKMWAVVVAVFAAFAGGVYGYGQLNNRVAMHEKELQQMQQFMSSAEGIRGGAISRIAVVESRLPQLEAADSATKDNITLLYEEQKRLRSRINRVETHVDQEIGREQIERKKP